MALLDSVSYSQQTSATSNNNLLAYSISAGHGSNQDDREEYNLPLGYRFSPRGSELITHYLIQKISGQQLPANVITEIDLYAFDPHQLPISEFKYGKPDEAYFFTRPRKQRRTRSGYWKVTGRDLPILSGKAAVGFKRILIFYEGKAPRGIKTPWVMHEFRVNPLYFSAIRRNTPDENVNTQVESYVVCKIRYKRQKHNDKCGSGTSSKTKKANQSDAESSLKEKEIV